MQTLCPDRRLLTVQPDTAAWNSRQCFHACITKLARVRANASCSACCNHHTSTAITRPDDHNMPLRLKMTINVTSEDGGCVVGTIIAVQVMQVVSQAPHEGQLQLLLHVLQPSIHHGCWNCHPRKAHQQMQEALKVLHDDTASSHLRKRQSTVLCFQMQSSPFVMVCRSESRRGVPAGCTALPVIQAPSTIEVAQSSKCSPLTSSTDAEVYRKIQPAGRSGARATCLGNQVTPCTSLDAGDVVCEPGARQQQQTLQGDETGLLARQPWHAAAQRSQGT